ncbi:MAG: TetR/AcrR family transcriptional regulator [Solirubrobacteraceae bacterium]|nr:TetR/AcrR family transcriptional regulator [Patulibacter sp.]
MTATRTQRRSAAIRAQIVDAAEAILAEHGTEGLTMEAVSAHADVAVQTVYNRVGGRSALLVAVAERTLEQNRDYLESVVAEPGLTAWERIEAIGFAYARFAQTWPEQFRLLVDPPSEPEALAPIERLIANQLATLAGLITEGIADGTINPALEPETTAKALWAMATGVFALAIRTDRLQAGADEIAALVSMSRALLQDGMRQASTDAKAL